MRRIMIRHLLRLLTDIKPGRTMRAAQPHASDLVTVDVAQRLAVEDVLEVGRWVAGIDDRSGGHLTRAGLVQQGKEGSGRSEWDMHGTVELEEDVGGVVDPV
jgi:hypothetical protein